MLRWIIALLMAANLAWLAWAQGWLRPLGLAPAQPGEPERVVGQWKPEALHVAPAPAAMPAPAAPADSSADLPAPAPEALPPEAGPEIAPASASQASPQTVSESAPEATPAAPPDIPQPTPPEAKSAPVCLQAGVFNEAQAAAWRRAAGGLPAGAWRLDSVAMPGRWMVYASAASQEEAARRRTELRGRRIDVDRPGASLEPGLSLGRYSSQEAAERARADLSLRGVSGLSVVREKRDQPAFMLRLPAADAALREKLAQAPLRQALAGKELRSCERE